MSNIVYDTEETCTGTGDTLTLTGATSGFLPFSSSVSDGATVEYFIVDSGGSIKAAGLGVYASGANTITRNDNWNRNGTTVDFNPSTNITLSGGSHTIRCIRLVETTSNVLVTIPNSTSSELLPLGADGGGFESALGAANTSLYHVPVIVPPNTEITDLRINVSTAAASALFRLGLAEVDPLTGLVTRSIAETADMDGSTTGFKSGSITNVYFDQETYLYAWVAADTAISFGAYSRNSYSYIPGYPLDTTNGRVRPTLTISKSASSITYPTPSTSDFGTQGVMLDIRLVFS